MRQVRAAIGSLALGALAAVALTRRPTPTVAVRPIPLPGRPVAIAFDATSGRVFLADATAGIDILDAASGALVRSVAPGTRPSTLVIDERGGRGGHDLVLILSGAAGSVRALDARSGAVLWTTRTQAHPLSAAVDVRTGRAFVVEDDGGRGAVGMFDTRSGTLLSMVGGLPSRTRGATPRLVDTVGDGLIGVDGATGRVFVVGERVTMLDARSGTIVRTVAGQPSWTEPWSPKPWAIAIDPSRRNGGGRVFVGDSNATTMIDAMTGHIVHTIPVRVSSGGLAADARTGRVFAVMANDTGVSMLDSRSGRVLRTEQVGMLSGGIAIDAAPREGDPDGRVFVSTLDGVQVLNARTGASIHTLKVGGTPGAIAIDGHTGNAYVIPDPTIAAEPGAPDALDTLVLRLRRWLPWLSRPAAPRAATDAVTVLNPSG